MSSNTTARAPSSYVIIIALTFCLNFGAYFAIANQLTSIFGQQGFYILTVIQFSFLCGTFLGQLIQDILGSRKMFILGSFSFSILSLTVALTIDAPESRWILYPISVFCGVCASWMWCAQGSYVSSLFSSDKQGEGFGKFNSIFSLNGVWAFLLLLVLAVANVKQRTIIWIFFGFSVLAFVSFFTVQDWPKKADEENKKNTVIIDTKSKPSVGEQFLAVGRMFGNKEMLLQAPLALWCGNTEGMYWGQMAQEYGSAEMIAAAFLMQSVVALFASITFGKFSDRYGRFLAVSICLIVAIVTNFSTGLGVDIKISMVGNSTIPSYEGGDVISRWTYILVGAFGFGISDFPAQAIMRAQYHAIWESDLQKLESAMPNMLAVLMSGTLAAVLYGGFVSTWFSLTLNSVLAAVALICQYFLPKHINRLNYTNPKLKNIETATVEVEKVVVTTTT